MNDTATTESTESSTSGHWGFWGTLIWGAVIAAVFAALQIITVLVAATFRTGDDLADSDLTELFGSVEQNGYFLSLATFVTTIVCCGLIVVAIQLKRGSALQDYLCLRRVSTTVMLKWIAIAAAVIGLSDLITALFGRPIVPDFVSAAYATAKPVWMLWIALVIAAPLFEELFFRGFLFKGLESSFIQPLGAVVATAAIWTVIHTQYDLYDMTSIFVLGLVLGASRLFTQSLVVPLVLHSLTNAVATIEAAMLG